MASALPPRVRVRDRSKDRARVRVGITVVGVLGYGLPARHEVEPRRVLANQGALPRLTHDPGKYRRVRV